MKTKAAKAAREKRAVKTVSSNEHEEQSNLEMPEPLKIVEGKIQKSNKKVNTVRARKEKEMPIAAKGEDLVENESNGLHEDSNKASVENTKVRDTVVATGRGNRKKPLPKSEGDAVESVSQINPTEESGALDDVSDVKNNTGKKTSGRRRNKKEETIEASPLDIKKVSEVNIECEPVENEVADSKENEFAPTKGRRGRKNVSKAADIESDTVAENDNLENEVADSKENESALTKGRRGRKNVSKAADKESDTVAENDSLDKILNGTVKDEDTEKGRRLGRGKLKQKVNEKGKSDTVTDTRSEEENSNVKETAKRGRKKQTKEDVESEPSSDNTVKTLDPIKEETEDETSPPVTQEESKSNTDTSNKRNLPKRKADAEVDKTEKNAKSSRLNKHSVKEDVNEELDNLSSKESQNIEEKTKDKKTGQPKKGEAVSDADNETGEMKTSGRGRKRIAAGPSKKTSDDSKKSKNEEETESKDTSLANAVVDPDAKNSSGSKWNLKISTWNVSGLRAWVVKDGLKYLQKEDPDIFVMQETKCSDDKLPAETNVEGYHRYWCASKLHQGHSGVALFSKKKPITVTYGFGKDDDPEGRVITAEYDSYYVINAYVPNSGRGLKNLTNRMKWDEGFRTYLKSLDSRKPIIVCGDMNVSHKEIDLTNPKTNTKNAGFTPEERAEMDKHLQAGFFDSFRKLYPDKSGVYTFWTYMGGARKKNVGWRLDYFLLSDRLESALCDVVTRTQVYGSDHCPVVLYMAI